MDLPVVVGAAILDGEPPYARVLATQRSATMALPFAWEFPGGKVEPGESEPDALRRECREELGLDVEVGERLGPEVPIVDGTMVLRVWTARIGGGELHLHEHADARWVSGSEARDLDWAPADAPIVAALLRLLDFAA